MKAGPRSSANTVYSMKGLLRNRKVLMKLTDGCIRNIHSLVDDTLLPSISSIVGYDAAGNKLEAVEMVVAHTTKKKMKKSTLNSNSYSNSSRGKVEEDEEDDDDEEEVREVTIVPTAGVHEQLVKKGREWGEHVNEYWHVLVAVGLYILISVTFGLPLFGLLGDAVWKIIDTVLSAEGVDVKGGELLFSLRYPSIILGQPIAYSAVGLCLQFIDALFFIYLGKHFTRIARIWSGRPYAARLGKRTIVIVDNPCNHQLLENFVSKLFSQAYSVVSVDVHGASGFDHFIHRFTHRVVRGLLIAVGRPDGRICCLAKSEAALLLAIKQAVFIRNPDYHSSASYTFLTAIPNFFSWLVGLIMTTLLCCRSDNVKHQQQQQQEKELEDQSALCSLGSGPDIITLGHNPYKPYLGVASHIVLGTDRLTVPNSNQHHPPCYSFNSFFNFSSGSNVIFNDNISTSSSSINRKRSRWSSFLSWVCCREYSNTPANNLNLGTYNSTAAAGELLCFSGRKEFVDEYLYDRLFLAQKPFTTSILRALRRRMDQESLYQQPLNPLINQPRFRTHSAKGLSQMGINSSSSVATMDSSIINNNKKNDARFVSDDDDDDDENQNENQDDIGMNLYDGYTDDHSTPHHDTIGATNRVSITNNTSPPTAAATTNVLAINTHANVSTNTTDTATTTTISVSRGNFHHQSSSSSSLDFAKQQPLLHRPIFHLNTTEGEGGEEDDDKDDNNNYHHHHLAVVVPKGYQECRNYDQQNHWIGDRETLLPYGVHHIDPDITTNKIESTGLG